MKTNVLIFSTAILAFCGVLLETAMNVTFPTLVAQFHVSLNLVQWVTTGYLLAVAATMMITGFLQRRFATRHLIVAALIAFLGGGVLCGLAPGLAALLLGRVIQGLATGIVMPLVFALIMTMIPHNQQGRYVGSAGMLIALAPSLGPTYGGLVTQLASWRWSFWLVMPLAVIAGILAASGAESTTKEQAITFPWDQFGLLLLGLIGLILGFNQLGSAGLTAPVTWLPLVVGVIGLLSYGLRVRHQSQPLISLKIFRYRQFDLALALYFLVQFMQLGQTFLLPNYAQLVLKTGSFAAGSSLLIGSLASALLSPLAGHGLDRFGMRRLAIGGSLFIVVATAVLFFVQRFSLVTIALGFLAYMIGFSAIFNNALTYGLQQLPQALAPDGNAAFNTLQQYAGSLGTAIVSAVLALTANVGQTSHATLVGTHLVYGGLLILGLIVLAGSLLINRATKGAQS